MRKIKFRAWTLQEYMDFPANSMIPPDEVNGDKNKWLEFEPEKETFILMQYTGLLDKNGKKIFEGDVVKVFEDNEFAPSIYTQRVEMHNGCWRPTMMFVNGNQIEVIGNIYESPELQK